MILNLNKPFRAILCAPNSPVVIIGDYKDYFQGFVAAKEYWRLKDDRDFYSGPNTDIPELKLYDLTTYYDKEDGTPCYKITDENGIEMFVDRHGNIQFAKFDSAPAMYGSYSNFGITELEEEDNIVNSFNTDVFNKGSYNMFFVN